MLVTVDSQIWIYYFDPNATENANVKKWMDKILKTYQIVISSIIPLEVSHNLYRIPHLSPGATEKLLFQWVTQENIHIIDATQTEMLNAMKMLKNYHSMGIGGRGCLILSAMNSQKVDTIVTHDKNLLSLTEYHRIDPVFPLPLIIKKNQPFQAEIFKENLKFL
ncbi:MAG: type II toxin-antitoxin system VapC family toxin [Promethearchaeota archaeon]